MIRKKTKEEMSLAEEWRKTTQLLKVLYGDQLYKVKLVPENYGKNYKLSE